MQPKYFDTDKTTFIKGVQLSPPLLLSHTPHFYQIVEISWEGKEKEQRIRPVTLVLSQSWVAIKVLKKVEIELLKNHKVKYCLEISKNVCGNPRVNM